MVVNSIVGKRANSIHIYSLAKADFVCVVAVSTAESFSKMVEKGDREKLIRGRNQRDRYTKTDFSGAVGLRIKVATGTAAKNRIVEPGTATLHSAVTCVSFPGTSVSWCAVIAWVSPIAAPLENIAVHIVQSKSIGGKTPYICCLFAVKSSVGVCVGEPSVIVD